MVEKKNGSTLTRSVMLQITWNIITCRVWKVPPTSRKLLAANWDLKGQRQAHHFVQGVLRGLLDNCFKLPGTVKRTECCYLATLPVQPTDRIKQETRPPSLQRNAATETRHAISKKCLVLHRQKILPITFCVMVVLINPKCLLPMCFFQGFAMFACSLASAVPCSPPLST